METLLIVLALSLDAFVASIAYGSNQIRIPLISILIIDIVCAFFLTISVFFGKIISTFLPPHITSIISFIILMIIGVYYLFEGIVKSYLGNRSSLKEKLKFKLFNMWFIIDIYIDETKADFNHSNNLDSREALYLATALSLDSLAIGFGSGLGKISYLYILLLSLLFDIVAIYSGLILGKKLVQHSKINLSWLAGVILIFLALLKLK